MCILFNIHCNALTVQFLTALLMQAVHWWILKYKCNYINNTNGKTDETEESHLADIKVRGKNC